MIKINLAKLLDDRHMTRAELARMTGIRPSTVSEICNNSCVFLKIANIDKICRALDCSLDELISFGDDA